MAMTAKRPNPKEPLLRYLRVQEDFDRQLYSVLNRAVSDIDKQLKQILGKGVGAEVRRDQLRLAKKVMNEQIAKILREAGFIIRAGRFEAAAAAIDSFQAYEKVLFSSLDDPSLMDAYLRSARATASHGMNAAIARMQGTSYIPLSKQVYRSTALATGQVDRYIESALARGLSAREFAAGAKAFVNPNVRGGVSHVAMRLARTEINNAFHAVQAQKARDTPWTTAVGWNLSGSHPEPDICNEYAEDIHYDGGEPGHFKPRDVPHKPHPHCLCFLTPETVSEDEFLDEFFAGKYDTYTDKIIARYSS